MLTSSDTVAAYCAPPLIWAGFVAWTILRLRDDARRRTDSRNTHRFGVGLIGLIAWVSTTAVVCRLILEHPPYASFMSLTVVGIAFLLLPICLWGGYFWGRMMEAFFASRGGRQ
jgi:hypothetical protein